MFNETSPYSQDRHETEPQIEALVSEARKLIDDAQNKQRDFLQDAVSRGMSESEIKEAAKEAFDSGQLPRVAEGERFRGSGAIYWTVFGKEVPEGEFRVAIDKDEQGLPSNLRFVESDDAELPYQEELDDPGDPDQYYVHGLTMPQTGKPNGSTKDWREHVGKLEKALRIS